MEKRELFLREMDGHAAVGGGAGLQPLGLNWRKMAGGFGS